MFAKIPATIESNATTGPIIVKATGRPGLTALTRAPKEQANCSMSTKRPIQRKNAMAVFRKP